MTSRPLQCWQISMSPLRSTNTLLLFSVSLFLVLPLFFKEIFYLFLLRTLGYHLPQTLLLECSAQRAQRKKQNKTTQKLISVLNTDSKICHQWTKHRWVMLMKKNKIQALRDFIVFFFYHCRVIIAVPIYLFYPVFCFSLIAWASFILGNLRFKNLFR